MTKELIEAAQKAWGDGIVCIAMIGLGIGSLPLLAVLTRLYVERMNCGPTAS